jgi:hypothetical protein
LLVGGAAVAGVAGGIALRKRGNGRRSPLDKLNLLRRDGKLDFDAIANGAQRVGELGRQIGDLAAAAERVSGSKTKR